LTAPILLRAQAVLAITRRAWLGQASAGCTTEGRAEANGRVFKEPGRPDACLGGDDVAAAVTARAQQHRRELGSRSAKEEFAATPGALRSPSEPASLGDAIARHRTAAARLVSRVYRNANAPLRADMLACLLRPLGTLSLVAVASGAFATLLQREDAAPGRVPMDMVARYSSEQILELARYVHEVNPETLEQLAALLTDSTLGATALSASALVLLYRRLRSAPAPSRGS
jgi:hypothetical protein